MYQFSMLTPKLRSSKTYPGTEIRGTGHSHPKTIPDNDYEPKSKKVTLVISFSISDSFKYF